MRSFFRTIGLMLTGRRTRPAEYARQERGAQQARRTDSGAGWVPVDYSSSSDSSCDAGDSGGGDGGGGCGGE